MVWPWVLRSRRRSHRARRPWGSSPGRGLVEEQDGRTVEDGAGHHEPLGHAAREGVDRRLGEPGELELLEQLVGRLFRLALADAEQAAVEVEVLPTGQLAVEGVLLGHHADHLLGQRGVGHDVDATDERLTRRGDHPGGQDADRGRLSGAVGAEQAVDLAHADVEVEPVDGPEIGAGIGLDQTDRLDDGFAPVARSGTAVDGRSSRSWCSHSTVISRPSPPPHRIPRPVPPIPRASLATSAGTFSPRPEFGTAPCGPSGPRRCPVPPAHSRRHPRAAWPHP